MSVLKIDNPGTQGIATTNTIALGTQTIATAAGTTNLTTASPYQTIFTGTTTQTVVLPPANTGIPQGVKYEVDNNSTGLVTVQTYGGATLWVLGPGTCLLIINTSISTAAGTWDNDYLGVNAISGKVINFLSNGNGGTAINDGPVPSMPDFADTGLPISGVLGPVAWKLTGQSTSSLPEFFPQTGATLVASAPAPILHSAIPG